jgi:hypothetical protein
MELRAAAWNLQNTLRRRREAYHRKIERQAVGEAVSGSDHASIHDRPVVVTPELREAMAVDSYGRFSWLDRLIHPRATFDETLQDMAAADGGDFVESPYVLVEPEGSLSKEGSAVAGWREQGGSRVVCRRHGIYRNLRTLETPISLSKTVQLAADAPSVDICWRLRNDSQQVVAFRFASEWNLALLEHETYLADESDRQRRLAAGPYPPQQHFSLWLPHFAALLSWTYSQPCELWVHAVKTVSQSESGFELQYQGHMLLPLWDVRLEPAEEMELSLTFALDRR